MYDSMINRIVREECATYCKIKYRLTLLAFGSHSNDILVVSCL
jgi:hypothetical protein